MRRIIKWSFLPMLVLALGSLVNANADQITIVPDQTFANFADFSLWSNTLFPELTRIANPPTLSTILLKVNPSTVASLDTVNYPNVVLFKSSTHKDGLKIGPNAFIFLHEANHLRQFNWVGGDFLGEGYTQAVTFSTFFLAGQDNPGLMLGWTAVMMADLRRNYNPVARGGEQNFYAQPFYDDPAGILEGIIGGNYFAADSLLKSSGWIATLKQLPDFDGSLAADRLMSSPLNYYNGQDGHFLYLEPTQWLNGKNVLYAESPVFNERSSFSWTLRDRKKGVGRLTNDGHLNFAVLDSTGKTMTSGLSDYNAPPGMGGGTIDPADWPDGGYKVVGCWVATNDECDPLNPNGAPSATTYFAVLKTVPTWWFDHIFVFANGNGSYGEFGAKKLVQTSGDIAGSLNLPGLLVINTSGSRGNVVVSDSIRSKTFSVAYRDPLYTHSPSRFIPWTGYSEKVTAVTTGSDFTPGILVPGQISTAWGNSFTPNAPTSFVDAPLPTTMDNLQVVVRSGGLDYVCPLFFTSAGQMNFQAPANLPVGPAEVRLLVAGQATNNIRVDVAESRLSLFIVQGGPAIVWATGPKIGQLITPQNPALPGDILAMYGTGLGAVTPPVSSGYAPTGLSTSIVSVEVSIAGVSAKVLWAGRAPGFVGLDQINVVVPPNVRGLSPLVLSTGNNISGRAMLAVGQ